MTALEFASFIDHTLLAPNATVRQITQLCQEAVRYSFASVCVNPVYVPLAASELANAASKVCTVIGFPLGATTTETKVFETQDAIKNGADEIDMVLNIGAAKDGRFSEVGSDIASVKEACAAEGAKCGKNILLKVILETCLLNDHEIESVCLCAQKAGADFVKTSTGFANPKGIDGNPLPNGASVHHVALMRQIVGKSMGVKASGGIRSMRTAIDLIEAGANRIGTSSGVALIENWDEKRVIKPGF